MKEDFLHFLWQFKKFDLARLYTTQGEKLTIISSGLYLQKAGPDFLTPRLSLELRNGPEMLKYIASHQTGICTVMKLTLIMIM